MGIIQSDEPSPDPEKLQKRKMKSDNSTSSSCGVRIGGLLHSRHLALGEKGSLFRNKYWGRLLQVDQLNHVLFSFFCHQNTFQKDICASILSRLFQLREVVTYLSYKEHRLNLFGVSLFIIYEAPDMSRDEKEKQLVSADLRMIDFGNSSHVFVLFLFFFSTHFHFFLLYISIYSSIHACLHIYLTMYHKYQNNSRRT